MFSDKDIPKQLHMMDLLKTQLCIKHILHYEDAEYFLYILHGGLNSNMLIIAKKRMINEILNENFKNKSIFLNLDQLCEHILSN